MKEKKYLPTQVSERVKPTRNNNKITQSPGESAGKKAIRPHSGRARPALIPRASCARL